MLVEQAVLANYGGPILRAAAQAEADGVNGGLVDRGGERDLVLRIDDGLQLLDHAQLSERGPAVAHLVQDASQRPYVRGPPALHPGPVRAGPGVEDGLRRHVIQGADLAVPVDVGRVVILDGFGDAKVDQLQRPANEEEVGGL